MRTLIHSFIITICLLNLSIGNAQIGTSCQTPKIIQANQGQTIERYIQINTTDGADFFEFTVPTDGLLTFSTCRIAHIESDHRLRVYKTNCDNLMDDLTHHLRCVKHVDWSKPVIAGEKYIFEWNINTNKPPENQIDLIFNAFFYYKPSVSGLNCSTPNSLVCPGDFELDLRGSSQWFSWTAPDNDTYEIGIADNQSAVEASGIPINVYEGTSCSTKKLKTDNDDDNFDFTPHVPFVAEAGKTYYFKYRDQLNYVPDGPYIGNLKKVGTPTNNNHFKIIDTTVCTKYDFNGQTYKHSGEYHANYTNTVGCDSLVVLKLTVDNSKNECLINSIATDNYQKNTTIYPNPTADYIHYESEKASSFNIYNFMGTTFIEKKLTIGLNRIDVQQLPEGIYLLQVEGSVYQFIKN